MTILVIDDETCVRELIGEVLKRTGCRVLEAGNALEGLEVARTEHPDAVLLDFLLPGISGVQVLQELKRLPATRSIPVILMSGVGADELLFEKLSYDAADFLMKPFSPAQLRQKVQDVCGPVALGAPPAAPATGAAPLRPESGIIGQLSRIVSDAQAPCAAPAAPR
jgi:CheY-like chemotaxis protein